MDEFCFTAIVENFNSNLWKYHFKLPEQIATSLRSRNIRRVWVNLNDQCSIQAGIMASGNESYFINLNQKLRNKLGIAEGSQVKVRLWEDSSEYGMPMPETLNAVLQGDKDANTHFMLLTPGKKRNLIYIINQVKSEEKAICKSIIVAEHLKRFDGKINFKALYDELKGT